MISFLTVRLVDTERIHPQRPWTFIIPERHKGLVEIDCDGDHLAVAIDVTGRRKSVIAPGI